MGQRDLSPEDYQKKFGWRFWRQVSIIPEDCWEWIGSRYKKDGYGQIKCYGKLLRAHRVSWELHYGKIPDGLLVCHRCDNPPCVRPDHLFLGTCRDNTQDSIVKLRMTRLVGESHQQHKITEEQARDIILKRGMVSQSELAHRHRVSRSAIHAIQCGRNWKHLQLKEG